MERKKKEVISLEKRTRAMMRDLEKERAELETMVREGREVISSVDKVDNSMFHSAPFFSIDSTV